MRAMTTWADVAARLSAPRNYWLATVGATGAPHVAPVWGVVVDQDLYVYSDRSTAKARNLARDPRVAVHLESGDDVVIVHGELADVGHPMAAGAVVAALAAKYDDADDAPYLPAADPSADVLYVLRPRRALMWTLAELESSQQRWTAD
jgi:PPOX class probable F420-dependent enzyme